MDFLEIRRKASQRAGERARGTSGEERAPGPREARAPEGLLADKPAARPAEPRPADEERPEDPLRRFFYREDEPDSPLLARGLEDAPRTPAPEAEEERREYLAFFLGDEEYALEISCLREIVRAPVITEVPRAPEGVLGVVTLRGEVLPVLDARRRLGLPAPTRGRPPRVVVCDAGGGPVGLLVDGVSQVVRLSPSAIEPRPRGVGGAEAGHVSGIGRDGDRLVIVLDPQLVLEPPRSPPAVLPEAGA